MVIYSTDFEAAEYTSLFRVKNTYLLKIKIKN
jgi:hypothetical protein